MNCDIIKDINKIIESDNSIRLNLDKSRFGEEKDKNNTKIKIENQIDKNNIN